jgi:nitroimidazol reductase NimA-like FMN-containing flavoprotein (pyridoxamine 5'-phosphate oxidase superfamily)
MMDESASGMEVLAPPACWDLLRSAQVGRLAVVVDGEPDIFPINYVDDHGSIVFRTAEGTKLAASVYGQPVAFEVDGYDPGAGVAWSVVVRGRASELGDRHEVLDTLALPLFPWHASPKPHFVRIEPTQVTGRRFHTVTSAAWDTPVRGARRSPGE